jgi:O-antigen/teichoic acid export membrane protein
VTEGTPTEAQTAKDPDAVFRTDHLLSDLRRRSVRGGSVTIVSQGAKFLLSLASMAVLARLMTPAEFGVVAKIYIFVGVAEILKDLGLSVASVQRENLTHRLASNLFWVNLAVSAMLAATFAAISPAVAWLYDDPRLVAVMCAFAGMSIFGGLAGQHQALLQRQMRFTALAVIEITARAIGVGAAILSAWFGQSYWALVLNLIVYAGAYALLLWPTTGWLPGWPSRCTGVGGMVKFGVRLTVVNLMNHLVANVNRTVIGLFAGDQATGLYDRAERLFLLPLQQVNAPVTAVALPMLSRLQDNPERFRRAYLQVVRLIQTITAPIVVFMYLWADQLILLVLGPQWTGVTELFRILAIAGLMRPLANTTGWLFITTDRTAEMLRWRLCTLWVTPVVAPIAFYLGGVNGVAWSMAATSLGMTFPAVWYAQRCAGIGFWLIVRAAGEPVLAALIAGLLLWPLVDHLTVLLAAPLMAIVHFAVACLLARSFEPVTQIRHLTDAFLRRRPT